MKIVMAYGWFATPSPFLSLRSYICIVLRQAGRSGLRTAWGCVLHCVYLIAWPPTVIARFKSSTKYFLSCSPLPNPKANLPGALWRRGKWPIYLQRVEASVNLYHSVNQAGTVRKNFGASSPRYLSCRLWLQNSFPTANVMSMQLDWVRGNGVTLLQVSGWAASGQAEDSVNSQRCTRPLP